MSAKKPVWVAPDEPESPASNPAPAVSRPGSLSAAAGLGRFDQLVALRDRLATEIDSSETLARDLASMSIRYMAVIREIDELRAAQASKEGDELGEAAESPDETFDPSAV